MFAALTALLFTITPLEAETERVHEHLVGALRLLRAVPADGFSPEVWNRRQQAIARLEQYTEARRYPRNVSVDRLTPIFVDDFGTRCAMAHLIEASGGGAFVEKVRAERNLAFVRELADEHAMRAWLAANGFTLAEAARVQPSYVSCSARRVDCICWLQGSLGLVSIERSTSAGAEGTIEMTWGPPVGGASVGSQFTVKLSQVRLEVGQRVVALLSEDPSLPTPWWPFENGLLSCRHEATCVDRPGMPLDEAIARAASPCCRAELAADPTWGEVTCYDHFQGACEADGGPFAKYPGDTTPQSYTCDGGEAVDGGFTQSPPPAAPRAASSASCSSSGSLLVAAAALLIRRRRAAFVTGS